ncbi:MAG: helix-turn-helix transcriptional regulator [Actinomycetota bacterium]
MMVESKRLTDRLRRILLLLPYAIRNPGIKLTDLAQMFGTSTKELVDDFNLVFFCGLPGYGPGDLIDISMDEGRVYVRTADYFSSPLRLTHAEALSLLAGATALAELPGMEQADALRRALDKLVGALRTETPEGPAPVEVAVEPASGLHLQTLQEALSRKKRVRLEYFAATRGELSERDVDPWGLLEALGRWYLIGWDYLRDAERMFRVDRMKSVRLLREAARTPREFDPERYRGAFMSRDDEALMTIEMSPDVARWFTDYYPVRAVEQMSDGWTRVELASGGPRWAATLLLRLGDGVRDIRPESLRARAEELAAAIAARYERNGQ